MWINGELIEADVVEKQRFCSIDDLWHLAPGELPETFTTKELAEAMDQPRWLAQKLAYCLREAGAIAIVGKTGNALEYQRCAANLLDTDES